MQNAMTVLWQVVIMFILAGVGYLMFRFKKITAEGSKAIGNILIYLSLPCVIINGFLTERTPEKLQALGISAAAAFVLMVITILVSRLVMGKRSAVENFASAFSNPGFFGIPLITEALGSAAVFYVAAYIFFVNILQWTHGVSLMQLEQGKKEKTSVSGILKKLITAPFMIAILIGLLFFFAGWDMPSIPMKCISFIANLNTPLAMFTIGIYLAQTDMLKMFAKPRLYLLAASRLVIIPLISMAALSLIPAAFGDMKLALLIAAACPVGSNVAVYAQLHNSDQSYAVETVVISTLLSIITLPLIIMLAGCIW